MNKMYTHEHEQKLSARIMRRVYVVWALRRVFSPSMVKCYILAVLGWYAVMHVSVGNVVANARDVGITTLHNFSASAFLNTETSIQLALLAGSALTLWLLRDVVTQVRTSRSIHATHAL